MKITGKIISKEWLRNTPNGNAVYRMVIIDDESISTTFDTAPNSGYTNDLKCAEGTNQIVTVVLKQHARRRFPVVKEVC